jgi:O-antigen ligase
MLKNTRLLYPLSLGAAAIATGYSIARFMGTPLIYAPLALLGGLVLLHHPLLGLLGMLFLIPGEELTPFIAGRTFVFILGAATFGAWLIQTLLKGERLKLATLPLALITLWFMWGLASSLWAQDQMLALGRAIDIVQGMLFLVLLQNLVSDGRRLKTVLIVYFSATVLFGLLAVEMGVSEGLKRAVVAEAQNPNALARALGIGLLLTPYVFDQFRRTWWRIPVILGSASLLLAIFMTGSRGAWLGLIAAVGFTWAIARVKFVKLRTIAAMIVLVLLSISLLNYYGIFGDLVIRRALSLVSTEQTIESARAYIWLVGWEMIKDNLLLGVGLQNFPVRFEEHIDPAGVAGKPGIYPGRDPHSIFLAAQAELGFPGLLVIVTLFWVSLRRLLPYRTDRRAICGILLILFMAFSGMVATIQYRKFFWLALGLAILIPMVIRREKAASAYPHTHVS